MARRSSTWFALSGAALLASLAMPALADQMRCGGNLIADGDSAAELRAHCGEPEDISRTSIQRAPLIWIHGRPIWVGHAVDVPVETWTYNFGPHNLMRRIRIEDGKIVSIDTLGYGHL